MKTILFKNLQFGVHVVSGDHIKPYPTSCGLIRINDEEDLKNIQSYVDGELEVIIDRSQPYFNRFNIPAWKQKIEAYKKGKRETLNNWQTTV